MMALNLEKELAQMSRESVSQLRERYQQAWNAPTNSRNRVWLIKRIAWRLQALEYGDLSERAKQRARELACDADLRLSPPKDHVRVSAPAERANSQGAIAAKADQRLPASGTIITRQYKDCTYEVLVTDEGLQFEGELYKSLSAIAKRITGQHMNGFRFFRLEGGKHE